MDIIHIELHEHSTTISLTGLATLLIVGWFAFRVVVTIVLGIFQVLSD